MRSKQRPIVITLATAIAALFAVLTGTVASATETQSAAVRSATLKTVSRTQIVVSDNEAMRVTVGKTGLFAADATGHTNRTAIIQPDISSATCTSSRATWVHVWPGPTCYGFTGGTSPWQPVDNICFGNNYGVAEVYNSNTGTYTDYYTHSPGVWLPSAFSEWGPGMYLDYLEIDGYTGGDHC